MKKIFLTILFFSAESYAIECAKLKYKDLPIFVVAYKKSLVGDIMNIRDKEMLADAKSYPKEHEKICLQIKCLKKRDKLSYEDLKTKIIEATDLPPMGKSLTAKSMDDLDLKNCSL